jgi:phosphatidylglycerophosphate synthase
MKEIIKEFKHIARDVTIYLLPGLTFLVYCVCLYTYYNNEWEWNILLGTRKLIIMFFIAYIFGHLIMGIMEVLFVITTLEDIIKNLIFKDKNQKLEEFEKKYQDAELEILAFENKEKYEFFVERHTLLSLFRWNLSGVFLITGIISIIASFLIGLPCYISIIQIILFICLLLFSIQTDLDGKYRRYYLATTETCNKEKE